MNLNDTASIVQILSVFGGVLIGLWRIWRKMDVNQTKTEQRAALMEHRLDAIQAQFGPNGGGLREAVNHISDRLKHMDSKLDCVTHDVAKLSGEFNQHMRENDG